MFISYFVFTINLMSLFILSTYIYKRNNKHPKRFQPKQFYMILLSSFIILTLLVHMWPFLDIKDATINEQNQAYYTLTNNDYSHFSPFKDYDISYHDDGRYVIACGNNKNVYGNLNEPLTEPFMIYSKIVMHDKNGQVLWHTDDLSPNTYELIYDNHRLDARSIEFLEDGNIGIFGLSIDLDTNIIFHTIVILDDLGNLVKLIDLDIANHGFTIWGEHDYYDIVSTDKGFTVEIDTTFRGSVMFHFDETYTYQWHVITDLPLNSNVSIGMAEEAYLDTLVYTNQAYYILNDSTIKKYNDTGILLWEQTYDFYVDGFDVFDDEIVLLSTRKQSYLVKENTFELRKNQRSITYIDVTRIDLVDGSIKDTFSFQNNQLSTEFDKISLYGHYTLKDDHGHYYVLAHDLQQRYIPSYDSVYMIMLFDSNFKYQGFSTIQIEDIGSQALADLLHKTSNYIENDQLYINGVLASNQVAINLSELGFDEVSMQVSMVLYNTVTTLSVYMANISVYLLIGSLLVYLVLAYTKKTPSKNGLIDDDLKRESEENQ